MVHEPHDLIITNATQYDGRKSGSGDEGGGERTSDFTKIWHGSSGRAMQRGNIVDGGGYARADRRQHLNMSGSRWRQEGEQEEDEKRKHGGQAAGERHERGCTGNAAENHCKAAWSRHGLGQASPWLIRAMRVLSGGRVYE